MSVSFSKQPSEQLARNVERGYVGVYFGQGVPVLDRDLNLLQDLLVSSMRSVIDRYIGGGVRLGSTAFLIVSAAGGQTDFVIRGDRDRPICLVGGIEVKIEADIMYSAQPGALPPTPPAAGASRVDTVYLDVHLDIEDEDVFVDLKNEEDVKVPTTVRLKPKWTVRVAEGQPVPSPAAGHVHLVLAQLTRPPGAAIPASAFLDRRQVCLTQDDIAFLVVAPRFDPVKFMSTSAGEPGTDVELFGVNFTVGDLKKVEVAFGSVTVPLVKHEARLIQVKVPDLPPGQEMFVTVKTEGGSARSPKLFRIVDPG